MCLRGRVAAAVRRLGVAGISVGLLGLAGCGLGSSSGQNNQSNSLVSPAKNVFGLHIHNAIQHWPQEPFSIWRLWDATVDWPRVETARGVFDFSLLDQYVSMAEQHNVQLIYVLGNTPQWAAQNPASPSNEGLPGASSPLINVQDWQDFVTAVATRYQGRIMAYEVWNEADLLGYWTGSISDMLQMAQIAYTTIKKIDPSAKVLAPSLVAGNGPAWLSTYLAGGGDKFTDAIPFHLYTTALAPEDALSFDQNVMTIAQQYGKPVWDTEVGFGPWGTFTDTQAAAFVARTFIVQSSLGVKNIVWYAWDDRGPWVHLYLVGSDFQTPTLAAVAFAEVQKWLRDANITCGSQSDFSWQCPMTLPDGTHQYIVWNPQFSETLTVPSSWGVTRAVDLQGNEQAISNGQIPIGASPLLLKP